MDNQTETQAMIKGYLKEVGLRFVRELDEGLIEEFGMGKGGKMIDDLCRLFDDNELRLARNSGEDPYIARQTELVDYLNQDERLSLLAASYYDWAVFRRFLELLYRHRSLLGEEILDIGCGNGILTCFVARMLPHARIIGTDLSAPALSVAQRIAGRLGLSNVRFCHRSQLWGDDLAEPVPNFHRLSQLRGDDLTAPVSNFHLHNQLWGDSTAEPNLDFHLSSNLWGDDSAEPIPDSNLYSQLRGDDSAELLPDFHLHSQLQGDSTAETNLDFHLSSNLRGDDFVESIPNFHLRNNQREDDSAEPNPNFHRLSQLQGDSTAKQNPILAAPGSFDTVLSIRTFHENAGHLPPGQDARPERCITLSRSYAGELAGLLRPGGNLVGIERYEAGPEYQGVINALTERGLVPIPGCRKEILCRCGDGRTAFQFAAFHRPEAPVSAPGIP